MKKSVTYILPSPAAHPTGGYKVVYEYANRLAADGYRVRIVYAGSLFFARKSLYFKATNCFRYLQSRIRDFSGRRWFALDGRVREYLALSLNFRHVPASDLYIATSPYTAMYVNDYPAGGKFYLIQDYEKWGNLTDEMLLSTYRYDMHRIVISTWLQGIMEREGLTATLIRNGFDFDYFRLVTPIEKRDRCRVAMLYHQMERKGCRDGFEALDIVKKALPQLRVSLFGTPERPEGLPDWYDYHRCPDRETHNRIYNEAAIFMGTSVIEGWGLTIGEAMICGAAVACTDNAGYGEMATDGLTALVSPVRDPEALARNVIRLIEEDGLRVRIATGGNAFIQRFRWEDSYKKLVSVLEG